MDFQFERFTAHGRRYSPQISIRSNGSLGLSQGALHRAGIEDPDWHVVLFYDRTKGALAIKPTRDPKEDGAVRLIVRTALGDDGKPSLSAFISAKSFLNFYGIPFKKTASHEVTWNEGLGMLVTILPTVGKIGPADQEQSPDPPD